MLEEKRVKNSIRKKFKKLSMLLVQNGKSRGGLFLVVAEKSGFPKKKMVKIRIFIKLMLKNVKIQKKFIKIEIVFARRKKGHIMKEFLQNRKISRGAIMEDSPCSEKNLDRNGRGKAWRNFFLMIFVETSRTRENTFFRGNARKNHVKKGHFTHKNCQKFINDVTFEFYDFSKNFKK